MTKQEKKQDLDELLFPDNEETDPTELRTVYMVDAYPGDNDPHAKIK